MKRLCTEICQIAFMVLMACLIALLAVAIVNALSQPMGYTP